MRDIILIAIACVAAILLGGWLYVSGTNSSHTQKTEGAVSIRVLDQGSFSGALTERKNYRIKSQEELEDLWLLVHGTGAPTNVDFSKDEVIAVLDGTHVTGGYEVTVDSVVDMPGGSRSISIVRTEPGASCVTTSAVTSPFQIIAVPKSGAPLVREEKTEVKECS